MGSFDFDTEETRAIIHHALDTLQISESARVIFIARPDKADITSHWKMSPRIDLDWLIIYLRKPNGSNEVY